MADDVTANKGVDPVVADAAQDSASQVIAGPKDPEHGERPVEYQARVDAATAVKGPAHLEPTTTHYWGGNSEFRSTGVIPMLPTLAGDLPAVQPVVEDDRLAGYTAALSTLPEHDEPTEENTKPE